MCSINVEGDEIQKSPPGERNNNNCFRQDSLIVKLVGKK